MQPSDLDPTCAEQLDSEKPVLVDAATAGQGSGVEAPLRTFKLIVAYDGSEFFGWQRQSSARSVQATIEDAIADLTGDEVVHLLASSRTDTGVHAIGQCATFRSRKWRAPAANIALALNTRLPYDVAIRKSTEEPYGFNPIKHCSGKRYRYCIYASRTSNPITRKQAWWVTRPLDIEAMQAGAQHLMGQHDFVSFQTNGSPRVSTIRTVRAIEIACRPELDGQFVTIEVEADGFLYNMVRNIVGTLVKCGTRHKRPEWVREALEARDRRCSGQTAPAHGLCLFEVFFDEARVAALRSGTQPSPADDSASSLADIESSEVTLEMD